MVFTVYTDDEAVAVEDRQRLVNHLTDIVIRGNAGRHRFILGHIKLRGFQQIFSVKSMPLSQDNPGNQVLYVLNAGDFVSGLHTTHARYLLCGWFDKIIIYKNI